MSKKLLIVSDDASFAEILKKRFEGLGFDVSLVAQVEAGLKSACTLTPRIILLALSVKSNQDGLSFVRGLRRFRNDNFNLEEVVRQTPVLVLSVMHPGTHDLFEREGNTHVLPLPYDAEKLTEKISALCQAQ